MERISPAIERFLKNELGEKDGVLTLASAVESMRQKTSEELFSISGLPMQIDYEVGIILRGVIERDLLRLVEKYGSGKSIQDLFDEKTPN